MEITCKLCGQKFEYPKESSCKTQLSNHLRIVHRLSNEEYLVKTEFNGVQPTCPCGCGQPLHLQKGWTWNKYASDTCYGRLLRNGNDELKEKLKTKRNFSLKEYYEQNYDVDSYKEAFELFESREHPLHDVAAQFNIDKRTLKLVWINLGIATKEKIDELIKYYQYNFGTVTKGYTDTETSDELTWIYKLIKANPGKYNIHSALDYYNSKHDAKYKISSKTLYKNLHKVYGDEIDVLLSYGLHSSEEYIFYNILKFYIPSFGERIEFGKMFVDSNTEYIYDFCIGNLLIEYDSEKTYHQTEEQKDRDLKKEKYALDNGYKFLRLTKTDILCPKTIDDIRKLVGCD